MSEFALQLQKISKTYGGFRANDSVDFKVRTGTIHGLAGENGAGKSTLMKILFGLVKPDVTHDSDSGVFINGKKVNFNSPEDAIRAGVGMVQQHFALAGPLSALDNIILGAEPKKSFAIDREGSQSKIEKLAGSLLKVPWSQNAEELSVGMQQRLEILKLLFRQAQILILDEPTAVLTPQEVEVFFSLLRKLKSEGKSVVLITHKLQEVLDLCDEVTILRHGKVAGTFLTKNLSRETVVRAMIGRDIKPVEKDSLAPGETLLEIADLSVVERTRGSLRNISFSLRRNEIVGIAGVEGNGQQALVEALLALVPSSGTITFEGKRLPTQTTAIRHDLNFGLISEDRHDQSLWLNASIEENVAIGFGRKISTFGFLSDKKMKIFAEETLSNYQLKMQGLRQPVKELSGGNQQKIVVAREITARKPAFLIASQPTRGVDVGAIEFIHQQILQLRKEGSAVLLLSSEIEELCALSDRILVFYEGAIVAQFAGPKYEVTQIGAAMIGDRSGRKVSHL